MCGVAIETAGWVRSIMGWQTVGHPKRMPSVVLYTGLLTTIVAAGRLFLLLLEPSNQISARALAGVTLNA